MRSTMLYLLLAVPVLAPGCARTPQTTRAADLDYLANFHAFSSAPSREPYPTPAVAPATAPAMAVDRARSDGPPPARLDSSARLEISTDSIEGSIGLLRMRVQSWGGYVQSEQSNFIACRIPPVRFQESIAGIKSLGSIVEQSIRSLSVDTPYQELTERIQRAEEFRKKLIASTANEQASERLDDVLKIAEIRRLGEDIDKLKTELNLLSERIQYATVEVRFQPLPPNAKVSDRRRPNRFEWVNHVGAESFVDEF